MAGRTTLRVVVAPGTMRGVGLRDVLDLQTQSTFSNANPPWKLQSGESVDDNMPTSVPVYLATNYTSSTDVYTILSAVEAAVSAPGYVRFPAGVYTISTLRSYGTNLWLGYANSNRKVMGWIGAGADRTFFVEGASLIPSDARAYALAPSNTSTPVPLINLQLSNTQTTVPIFVSGICFQGRFQGPYGVPASSGLSVNTTVASPIAHRGLVLNAAVPGSRIQFCRFQGFAFTIKASPPYELSGLESDNETGLTRYRIEVDGRLPTGELSAGGDMINYPKSTTIKDSWLHDTRRSGFAIHEHTGVGDNGTYVIDGYQVEDIATTADGFAGSGLGFNASNVEEVSGTMTYTNCRFALDRGYDITLGTTAGGTLADAINVADFTSLTPSSYNGCLVVRIIKTPNSSGSSPYWNLFNSGGLAALPIHATSQGQPLTPIASSSFNPSTHTRDKNFVVVTS